ncbi:PAS domain S-box protein [bacterium]|nr:PAS domain S-box protein [bacterium]
MIAKESYTILEGLLNSADKDLSIKDTMELLIKERLVQSARIVSILYEHDLIDNPFLKQIAAQNNVKLIDVYNREGIRVYSSQERSDMETDNEIKEGIGQVLEGSREIFIAGVDGGDYQSGLPCFVVLRTRGYGAILVGMDTRKFWELKKQFSLDNMMKNIIKNPASHAMIGYIALQDDSRILASCGDVQFLEGIRVSSFLTEYLKAGTFGSRIRKIGSKKVFETVRPFYHKGSFTGLFRIGHYLSPPEEGKTVFRRQYYTRIAFGLSLILVIGVFMLGFLMVRQNLDIVEKECHVIDTYSSNIFHNVSDAIIVYDSHSCIKVINHAAKALFQRDEEQLIGRPLNTILGQSLCDDLSQSDLAIKQISCKIRNLQKVLLVSKTVFSDRNEKENSILVLHDITEMKRLEEQIQHKEHLTELGQLAASIAHEIRNPLNTISTIIQQLGKDFKPKENNSEYQEFVDLIHQEALRINKSIQGFLHFARLNPIQPRSFLLSDLFLNLSRQFESLLSKHKIVLSIEHAWDGNVYWDYQQILQVFVNLLNNAIDVLTPHGIITIKVAVVDKEELEIMVHDTGPGIPPEIQPKIFNLYFTTKPKGTGIGLSIVQRIIYEHGGMISVETAEGRGTTFIMRMPKGIGA